MMKRLVLCALFIAFFPAFANAALTGVNVSDLSVNGTIVVGNPTSLGWNANSINTTLSLNVSIGASTTPYDINVTWYLPYGMQPANGSNACNGSGGFRVSSLNFQNDRVACSVAYTLDNATFYQLNLTVNANISAFKTFNRSNGVEESADFWANVSGNATGDAANDTEQTKWYGNNYYINPRPDFIFDTTTNSNFTAYVTTWKQTDAGYYVSAPLMTFNSTSHMPQAGNASYADVLYFDKSMMERPSYMRMYSYNLTFHVMMNGTGTQYFVIRSINTTATEGATPSQALEPLLTQNQSMTDFIDNVTYNFTMSMPSPDGFNLWYNGSTSLTASEAAALGFNASFVPGQLQNSVGIMTVNITNSSWNNTDFTVLFTVLNQTATTFVPTSPIYVVNQSFTGLDFSHGPRFGENVTMNYLASLNNGMANFTFNNVSVRFTIPLNVTGFNTSDANQNFTHTMSTGGVFSALNATGTGWNSSSSTNYTACLNMTDPNPNSPSNAFNITVCFQVLDIQLASATYGSWNPGSVNSNITLNFSAIVSFPVMEEANNTPGTVGSTNYYNATFSPSMRSSLNLTNRVPGIADAGCAATTVILDGITLTCGTNYTIGSLTLGDVSSGSHSISVSYTLPTSTTPITGGGSSSPSPTPSAQPTSSPTPPAPPQVTSSPVPSKIPSITPSRTPAVTPSKAPQATITTASQVAAKLTQVNALLSQAKQAKVDVAAAQRLLNLAQQASSAGNYADALDYANQAEENLRTSITAMQALQTRQAGGFDSMLLAVVIVIALAGGYYYFFMRKPRKGM